MPEGCGELDGLRCDCDDMCTSPMAPARLELAMPEPDELGRASLCGDPCCLMDFIAL
jgi:hypothetical protein